MQNKIKIIENKNTIIKIDDEFYIVEEALDMIKTLDQCLDIIINMKSCITRIQNSYGIKF